MGHPERDVDAIGWQRISNGHCNDALGNTAPGSDAITADNTKPASAASLQAYPGHQKLILNGPRVWMKIYTVRHS